MTRVPAPPRAGLQREARALGDPTRHAIFRAVADAAKPVSVAELTARFSLNHNAIRQHLGKLLAAGLVIEERASPRGPGRPRLLYSVEPGAESRWGVAGPYERLSRLLAEVISTGATPEEVGRSAGRRRAATCQTTADGVEALSTAMAREGFDPVLRRRGDRVELVLQSCPYESTALSDPDTVCALHLGLAEGMVEGTGLAVDRLVRKDPRRAGCVLHAHIAPDPRGL